MNLETGSFSRKRPSSWSIIIATLVIGLVIEQMRKMVSGFIALPDSLSIIPWALNQATQPLRATRVTEPESRFSSISRWTIAPMRSRRWADKPTDSGLAVGSPWAKAVTHPTMASQKTSNTRAPLERTTLFIRSPPFLFHREDAKTRRHEESQHQSPGRATR